MVMPRPGMACPRAVAGPSARRAAAGCLLWALCLVSPAVQSQGTLSWPDSESLERAMAAQRDQLPDLDADALSAITAQSQTIDLAGMAAAQERRARGPSPGTAAGGPRPVAGLLVFVSLGMPAPTLDVLIGQAERMGARMVMRGLLDRSMRKTVERVRSLIGTRRVAWTIDPEAFERFAVTAVPTVVLVDARQPVNLGCDGGQCGPQGVPAADHYSKLVGDVSLDHAMAQIARDDPVWAGLAQAYQAKLRTVP